MFKKIYFIIAGAILVITTLIGLATFSEDNKIETNDRDDLVDVYFFHSNTCPHCEHEKEFLRDLNDDEIATVYSFETHEEGNLDKLKNLMNFLDVPEENQGGVPFTVIGDSYTTGWEDASTTGVKLKERIEYCEQNTCPDKTGIFLGIKEEYLAATDTQEQTEPKQEEKEENEKINLTFFGHNFGDFDTEKTSLPIAVFVIAAVDGFNPCAMWVLIFLITLLIDMKDKKKMFILGGVFILISGFIYFLILMGWSKVFDWLNPFISWINAVLAVIALVFGYQNLKSYAKNKAVSCKVTNSEERQKTFEKIKKIIQEKSFLTSLIGIILLAFSVNIVEFFCSSALPAVYTGLLNEADISGTSEYLYHGLYSFVFMLDDLLVFTIAMITLNVSGIAQKFNRPTKLIGGIVMSIIALYLYWEVLKAFL